MREVAAEAGVSLRLVQYYFGTKEELLLAAMQHLATQFSDRAMARIRQSRPGDGPASPRDIIGAILAEGCPPTTSGAPSPSCTRLISRCR